ncbi:hypothetical protein F4779DRAFT_599511 [Xylariaceae sp. FL0662B]|nr:hypothetical protein F4779DRAFT_599511 [Xylariaceae sp. FL0662B]
MSSYGGKGPMVNGVLWMQVALAAVFVGLRLYTRTIILNNIGWDDYFTVLSLILLIIFSAFTTNATMYGLGRLAADINNTEHYIEATKNEIIGQVFGILVVGVSKTAVACFLLRIMVQRWHKMVLWFCIISTCGLSLFAAIVVVFQCIPVDKTWNRMGVEGYCWINFTPLGITTAAWSVVMDFSMALLPCFVVWQLKMKRKEKIVVMSGLSLGIFAGICGMIRTIMLTYLGNEEYILDTVPMLIWSDTEGLVTIMCSSIPVLRPLYVQFRYGTQGGSSLDNRSYPLGSRNRSEGARGQNQGDNNIFSGAGKDNFHSEVGAHANNSSEESILRDTREQNGAGKFGGIQRTDEVSVSYTPNDKF